MTGLAASDVRRSWRTTLNKAEQMTGPERYLRAEELLSGLNTTHPDPENIATAPSARDARACRCNGPEQRLQKPR